MIKASTNPDHLKEKGPVRSILRAERSISICRLSDLVLAKVSFCFEQGITYQYGIS
jgi:hypothetical protein